MALFGVQKHAASSSLFFQASRPKRTWTKFLRTTLGLRHSWECLKTNSSAQGMAIDEDDAHNQNSMEMSPDSGLADLWSSLSPFMENKGQEASAASQSLMGLSSSLFNDANSFVVDKEDPAEYIPAPAISAAGKGFIHAVWTLAFPKEPHSTLEHNTSSLNKCAQSSPSQLNLCGESKFEVDRIGQVTSIESKWHVTREGEEELDSLKLLLTSSLLKEVHS